MLKKNVIANFLGRGYSGFAHYFFVPAYVNLLGLESFGVISFYSVILAFTLVADVGLSATFSRVAAASDCPRDLVNLLVTIECLLLAVVGTIALGFFFSSGFIANNWLTLENEESIADAVSGIRLMSLMLVPQLCITLYAAGLIGLQRQVRSNALQSLFITIRSGVVIFVLWIKPSLEVFFLWQLVISIAFAFLFRSQLKSQINPGQNYRGKADLACLRVHAAFAGGMMWISFITALNRNIDKSLVSTMFTASELGAYSLASNLAQIPVAFATPIAVALYPLMTQKIASGRLVQALAEYRSMGSWLAYAGSTSSFSLVFFAEPILAAWLGDVEKLDLLQVLVECLAVGTLLLCLAMPSYYLFLAGGRSGLVAKVATVTAFTSIPLLTWCIWTWGLVGATFAWIALNGMNLLVLQLFIRKSNFGASWLLDVRRTLVEPVILSFIPLLLARELSIQMELPGNVSFELMFLAFGSAASAAIFWIRQRAYA